AWGAWPARHGGHRRAVRADAARRAPTATHSRPRPRALRRRCANGYTERVRSPLTHSRPACAIGVRSSEPPAQAAFAEVRHERRRPDKSPAARQSALSRHFVAEADGVGFEPTRDLTANGFRDFCVMV